MKKRFCGVAAALFLTTFLAIVLIPASASAAVTLNDPRFGVANQSTFNISISTALVTNCRYTSPFEKSYADMTDFTQTSSTAHKLLNFLLPSVGQVYKFYVECADAEKDYFNLSVDLSPPVITKAVAFPAAVIQTPLQAKLVVETNENTSCRYDNQNNNYDLMRFFFNTNDADRANYGNYHEAALSGLTDKTDYNYGIICLDVSQQLSGISNITFKVDTSVPAAILQVSPPDGNITSSLFINIYVTTNKNSVCSYGNTTEYKETGGNFSMTTLNHQASLKLEPGQYKYYIKCIFEGPKEVTADTSFVVDNTPPKSLSINDTQDLAGVEEQYTYLLDRLTFKFTSEDPESGIDIYFYSIIDESTGEIVVNWTSTSEKVVTVRNLMLKDRDKYYVNGFSKNRAGLISNLARSDGVVVNVLLNTAYACSDRLKDGDESDVDCGGSCSAKCPSGKACVSGNDCKTNYCVGNVCKSGNCTDSIQNQDESDVDCGGSCTSKCDLRSKCLKNSDCETGLCSEGLCAAEGPCSNKRLDDGETDVDCGGLCVTVRGKKCALLQKCTQNSDCITGYCGTVGKCANQNDKDGDGISNDADLCPDLPSPNADKRQTDTDQDKIGDECDPDNDNDGIPNEWEKKYGFNPLNPKDAELDADGDGLNNLDEYKLGTSPKSKDTDKDGADDGKEAKAHTDPKDPKSKPGSGFVAKATKMLIALVLIVAAVAAYLALKKGKGRTGGASEAQWQPPSSQQNPGTDAEIARRHNMPYAPQQAYPTYPPNYPAQQHQYHHKSRHEVFEELEKTYSQLSGEALFEHLRRKTRNR